MVSMTATWTDACTMVLAGYLSDRLGYASIGLVGMMVGVMGGILALLGNMQGLILSRLCTGMGNGVALLILPMYIAKSIHVMEYRQVCLALFQFGVIAGTAMPYVVSGKYWQSTIAMGGIPALVVFFMLLRLENEPVEEFNIPLLNTSHTSTTKNTLDSNAAIDRVAIDLDAAFKDSNAAVERVEINPAIAIKDSTAAIDRVAIDLDTAMKDSNAAVDRVEINPAIAIKDSTAAVDRVAIDPAGAIKASNAAVGRVEINPAGTIKDSTAAVDRVAIDPAGAIKDSKAAVIKENRWKVPWKYIGIGLLLAYANNAIDACLFYGPEILIRMGASVKFSMHVGFVASVVTVVAALTSVGLIKVLSRRVMYLGGLMITVFCYFGMGYIDSKGIVVGLMMVLVWFYQCGPGTLFIVILSELFLKVDAKSRGRYVSICTVGTSVFSILINGTLLSCVDYFGMQWTFTAYGFSFLVTFLILFVYLPET